MRKEDVRVLQGSAKELKRLADDIAPVPMIPGMASGSAYEDRAIREFEAKLRAGITPQKVEALMRQALHLVDQLGWFLREEQP